MIGADEIGAAKTVAVDGEAGSGFSQDFTFTDSDFNWLRGVASRHSGIVLPEGKRNMIYSRLAKRLRVLRLKKFSEYRRVLESGDQEEFGEFINALTTNLTSFFRERHHFDHLRDVALPELLATRRSDRQVRIWSSACSTGEEPYTTSLVVKQALSDIGSDWNYRILATDLDTQVLSRAASGVYPAERVASLDRATIRRWFLKGVGSTEGSVRVKSDLRQPITFQQLNLVKDWSLGDTFDIIFCRNVVIYFDKPTQKLLFNKIADVLTPNGYLYIGHSESLFQLTDRFALVGKTTYQRVD